MIGGIPETTFQGSTFKSMLWLQRTGEVRATIPRREFTHAQGNPTITCEYELQLWLQPLTCLANTRNVSHLLCAFDMRHQFDHTVSRTG